MIYDGPNETGQIIGRYCGRRFPWSVYSTSHYLTIRIEDIESWQGGADVIQLDYTFNGR